MGFPRIPNNPPSLFFSQGPGGLEPRKQWMLLDIKIIKQPYIRSANSRYQHSKESVRTKFRKQLSGHPSSKCTQNKIYHVNDDLVSILIYLYRCIKKITLSVQSQSISRNSIFIVFIRALHLQSSMPTELQNIVIIPSKIGDTVLTF